MKITPTALSVTQILSSTSEQYAILGPSKMNGDTFDYYSQLPAPLVSAGAIARRAPYLSGFGHAPYDYRLLI